MRTNENMKNTRRRIPRSWKKIVSLLRLAKVDVGVVVKRTMTLLTATSACLPPSLSGTSIRTRKHKPVSAWSTKLQE